MKLNNMELIKSGIDGLDEILNGGMRKNSSLLISGVPGVGKTIFALQFIYAGARLGESGLFVSCEEKEDSVYNYAKSISMDFDRYKDKINLLHTPIIGKVMSFGSIIDVIKQKKIKRVVLDSLTFFSYADLDQVSFRKEVSEFLSVMKANGVTVMVTSEREIGDIDNVTFKPEDFLFEGLILLFKIRKGSNFERCVTIQKMRGQDHMTGIYPFTIGKNGIEIYPKQFPFSLVEKSE